MAKKCKYKGCETFSRKLTGAELRNLENFNLSKESCRGILHGTIQGLCVAHAAHDLADDFRPSQFVLKAIESSWDPQNLNNFADAYAHARCGACEKLLKEDRDEHTPAEVRDILMALDVSDARIENVVCLQGDAISGSGKCFECCIKDANLYSSESSEYDTPPVSYLEARVEKAQAEKSALEAKREVDRKQREARLSAEAALKKEISELQSEKESLTSELNDPKLKQNAAMGKAELERYRERAVGAYKLYCEVEAKRPDDALIEKMEQNTDLSYLDKQAEGYFNLIDPDRSETKAPKTRSRPSEVAPSEPPSSGIDLEKSRSRAISNYRSYMELEGKQPTDEAINNLLGETNIEHLNTIADRYHEVAQDLLVVA